jgi:hypothetical protein
MTTPLVFDTGDSIDLSPFRADLLDDYEGSDLAIQAVGSVGKVVGRGTVLGRFTTRCGGKSTSPHTPTTCLIQTFVSQVLRV